MNVAEGASLAPLNTLGVDATARRLVTLETPADVERMAAEGWRAGQDLVLGGGSNVLIVEPPAGTVWLNRLRGRRIVSEDADHAVVEAAAGESWHELVLWSIARGLSGIENLALIPGLAGAAPMQNIGAYGVELADTLESVDAWDLPSGAWRRFTRAECRLAYRDSRFKRDEAGRWLIASLRLRLAKRFAPRLDYAGLADELAALGVARPGPAEVAEAVCRLRRRKLPDPSRLPNAGSFFKNPVVSVDEAEALRTRHPGLPCWPADADRAKLGAAWMIERCGWKGHREDGAGVAEGHALVLVNHGGATGHALWTLARRIQASVAERFGVRLEPEPHIVGAPGG